MADTQTTQNGKQETAKQETKQEAKQNGGPTKIPVTRVWLREQIDMPGGHAIMERLDCLPQTAPGRQFFVGRFVPAYQVIEIEWYKTEKTEPYRTAIPLAFVKRFDY